MVINLLIISDRFSVIRILMVFVMVVDYDMLWVDSIYIIICFSIRVLRC